MCIGRVVRGRRDVAVKWVASLLAGLSYGLDSLLITSTARRKELRKCATKKRLDGCEAGANDGNVDLKHGPARDDYGIAVCHGHAMAELDSSYEGNDADTEVAQ